MAELISFDPNVEVLGRVVLAYLNSFINKELAMRLIAEHGIRDINPDKWYPLQDLFDGFKEISNKLGTGAFFRVGEKIPENAKFPEHKDIFEAFTILDQAYHMNHRGGEIGHYILKEKGENHIIVEANNPYPCELDKGLCLALALRYKPTAKLTEEEEIKGCRKKGGDSCIYRISW
jgi:hypothetical protein